MLRRRHVGLKRVRSKWTIKLRISSTKDRHQFVVEWKRRRRAEDPRVVLAQLSPDGSGFDFPVIFLHFLVSTSSVTDVGGFPLIHAISLAPRALLYRSTRHVRYHETKIACKAVIDVLYNLTTFSKSIILFCPKQVTAASIWPEAGQ